MNKPDYFFFILPPMSALPLVTLEKDKFVVNAKAIEFLSSVKGTVAVVAIAGLYRFYNSSFLFYLIIIELVNPIY